MIIHPYSILALALLCSCAENAPKEPVDVDADGFISEDDCDDNDPLSTIVSEDADCDGVLTAVDCDDASVDVGSMVDDQDCDGLATADDCDDADAEIGSNVDDADCDGFLSADDCDDTDDTSTIVVDDADCDGTPTADDCDDTDDTSTIVTDDADCDGLTTDLDCDDNDPLLGAEGSCDPVCYDAFELEATTLAHSPSFGTAPFHDCTTTRTTSVPDNPYTRLATIDRFDFVTGDELPFPTEASVQPYQQQNDPRIVILNPQGLGDAYLDGNIYASFSGPELDVNSPSDFCYHSNSGTAERHYRGGELVIYGVNPDQTSDILAEYEILEMILHLDWLGIGAEISEGAMDLEVKLDTVVDNTGGFLTTNPDVASIFIESDDAIVNTSGSTANGEWSYYTENDQVRQFVPEGGECAEEEE